MAELDEVKRVHQHCTGNRQALAESELAGCFYCCALFPAGSVTDWVDGPALETGDLDDGITALCPKCGIDSVLPSASVPLSRDLLVAMRNYWF